MLRAHRPAPGSQCLWERVEAEIVYTVETSHYDTVQQLTMMIGAGFVNDEEIKGGKKAPALINTIAAPLIKEQPKLSSINFIFTPSEITVRQCQCTAEINITNISHKQAQKKFFKGSFKSNGWMRKISL